MENSSKSMCAQCMLKGELFNSFHVEPSRGEATEIRFKVNVAHLLECMAIYGKDSLPVTSMHMSYDESEGCVACSCAGMRWLNETSATCDSISQ